MLGAGREVMLPWLLYERTLVVALHPSLVEWGGPIARSSGIHTFSHVWSLPPPPNTPCLQLVYK